MPVLWLKPYEARRIKKQRTLRRNNKSDPVSTAVPSKAVPSTAAPTLAQARVLKTIIIVLSRREAFEERQVIRDTWAMGHTNVFFIVGKPCEIPLEHRKPWVCERKSLQMQNDNTYALEQSRISEKLLKEKDIVHVDTIDVYRNLAEKLKLAYKWVFKTHGKAYVLKVDLDTFVRVSEVESFVKDRQRKYECIVGGVSRGKVARHGKWAETKYKKDTYPPFPSGSGHIVSPSLLEYIVTHEMVSYQGEDTSLGIFFDESDIDVTFTETKRMITHSGDCFNKHAMVVGHNIGVSQMKKCYNSLYNLDYPNGMKSPLSWSQYGQDRYVAKALPEGKYFVEIGGYDGEKFSNTLLLEKKYGWNGLLVEANPYTYKILKSRNRRAKSTNACIGTGSLTFKISGSTTSALELITGDHLKRVKSDINLYGKSGDKRWAHSGEEVTTKCVSILTLLDSTDIDYFSLDVEGGELYILQSLEWDKLNIKMFSIEVDQHKTEIIELMTSKGYKIETELRGDIIFKKAPIVTLPPLKPSKLFLCGYRLDYLSFIYPNRSIETYDKAKSSTTNDVLLNGLHGPSCDIDTFKGKIIHVNGESTTNVPSNTFGPGGNLFYYVQAAFQRIPNASNLVFNRPKNTKEKFMYYAQRNCVKHREDAFDKLSQIKPVDAVGACKNNVASTVGFPDRSKWQSSNWKYPFTKYRFSLCMENKNALGYITEKILMAFLAGTVPVYYGTEEVFDIFNRKAFVYYDVKNPEKAIAKIKFLEDNPDEYDKMLNEPILNTGSFDKYFSKKAIATSFLRRCASIPKGIMWDTFTNIVTILNQMNAPYNLHGGSLLSWYRDCSLGASDIDFTIDLKWFAKHNAKLKNELLNQGWKQKHVFGTFGKAGYEEAWVKHGIKVDLFSQTLLNGKYTNGLTVHGITYPCVIEKNGTEVTQWGNLSMKVPIPIEGALKSLYNDWKTPVKNYAWDIHPFKKGNQCTKKFTL